MRYLFLLVFIWAGAQVQSQKLEPTSLAIPDSLRTGSSVVLEYTTDYRIQDHSSATVAYRKVITLLDSDHEYGNTLYEFYDADSKITSFAAASYDALGNQIDRARSGDIADRRFTSQSTFYENTRYKQVAVACPSYPCTVVFEVEEQLNDFALVAGFNHWKPQKRDQSLLRASLTVSVPLDNDVLYRAGDLSEPVISSDGKSRTYAWTTGPRAAQLDESCAPSSATTLPYLRLALADFEIDGYRGSFRSWKEYGNFMQTIMQGRDALPPRLAQEVQEVVAGARTEWEKVDRLYRFMQQRMRYVSIQLGLGGWQPFSADYVEQNRFGDCKALSNYMGAMLASVDIPSYPVLISWDESDNYPVVDDYVTPAFNHMVLYVPSQDTYLECTSNNAPTGYLGEDKQDRNVLWITPEGGELHRTPAQLPAENGHTRTIDVTLTDTGKTALDIRATFYGGAQEWFRQLNEQLSGTKDQIELLHRRDLLPDVSGSAYSLKVDPDAPRATVHYRTEVADYVRKLGSRMFVPINSYYGINRVPEADDDRQLPIHLTETRMMVDTVQLHFPPTMEIESGLFTEPLHYTHAAGVYDARMEATEDGARWIRTLKLLPVDLPREAYAEFRQFFLDVAKADNTQVVLRERRTK
ncbi:hypothetical protein LEM8419_02942 [Neolewinella maritima]|uniref:DUF3857 domain-containing protein n=1 Tax=Neolewinella maritima TaxID=1383882 RepID=A0ABN8FAQ3_9BACT|nr:DUF3857 domain-containing protein [Neolewinella maritima]CAH1002027.1 hypothetical protein LEM8419_02942 [Neolewinella maritima]